MARKDHLLTVQSDSKLSKKFESRNNVIAFQAQQPTIAQQINGIGATSKTPDEVKDTKFPVLNPIDAIGKNLTAALNIDLSLENSPFHCLELSDVGATVATLTVNLLNLVKNKAEKFILDITKDPANTIDPTIVFSPTIENLPSGFPTADPRYLLEIVARETPTETRYEVVNRISGAGTIPVGTADFQHLEWDNTDLKWDALDAMTLQNATGIIKWKNAAGTEEATLSVTGIDNFLWTDFTTGAPHTMGFSGLQLQGIGHLRSDNIPTPSTGFIQLGNTDSIAWRNAANTNNASFEFNAADNFEWSDLAGSGILMTLNSTELDLQIGPTQIRMANNVAGSINWRNALDTESLSLFVSSTNNLTILDFTTGAPHDFFVGDMNIKAIGFLESGTTGVAGGGFINMANAETIEWRNAAGTTDASLQFSGADAFAFFIGANLEMAVGDLDVTIGSGGHAIALVPSGDGLSGADLGGGTQAWNDLNIDRILLRHNDGVLATIASIGVFSTALVLNTPTANEIFLRVNNVDEFFFDSLGFKIKNLNSIFFLDATDTQDARIEYLDPVFRIVAPDMEFEVTSVTPNFNFFGPNSTTGLLANLFKYFGKNTTPAIHEYARMEIIQDDAAALSEDGSIRWALTENGTEDVGYLRLNALFQEVQVFKDLVLGSVATKFDLGARYAEFDAMTAPSHTTATKRFLFQDIADNHMKIRTNTGLIDLETGGEVFTWTANHSMDTFALTTSTSQTSSKINLGVNEAIGFENGAQTGTFAEIYSANNLLFFEVDGDRMQAVFDTYETALGGSVFFVRHARGTKGGEVALVINDELGGFQLQGWGTSFSTTARVQGLANEAFTGTAKGTRLEFRTTDDGTVVEDLNLTLEHDGTLSFEKTGIGINFLVDGHTIIPTATALTIDASVSTDTIDLQTGGVTRLQINGSTSVGLSVTLDMNNNDVREINQLIGATVSRIIDFTPGFSGIQYEVALGHGHRFTNNNGVSLLEINNNDIRILGNETIRMPEKGADPATPPADNIRVYAKQGSGGSGALFVIDDLGAVVELGPGGSAFADNVFEIFDDITPTKKLQFSLATAVGNNLFAIFGTNDTYTFPDAGGTVIMSLGAQTITGDKTVSGADLIVTGAGSHLESAERMKIPVGVNKFD